MARVYSQIYHQMIRSENDIVGFIAYSIYKESKQKYIEDFRAQNGTEPSEEDFQEFYLFASQPNNIKRCRAEAYGLVSGILSETFDVQMKEAVEAMRQEERKELETMVRKYSPSFWSGVLQGVVGSFVFAIILAAIAFVVKYSGRLVIDFV